MASAPVLIDDAEEEAETVEPRALDMLAAHEGDLSHIMTDAELTKLGTDVIEDYERDLKSREDWQLAVEEALRVAAQEPTEAPDWPWEGCSDAHFPILTQAAIEFNARAYPAIVKGDEVIQVKVIGSDKGRKAPAQAAPQGQPLPGLPGGEPLPEAEPQWITQPGAKTKRAQRVREYLNTYVMYRMDDWEADTDALLLQLPIVGCGFKKCWWAHGKFHSAYLPALKLVVDMDAKSLKTVPRTTEELDGEYPYQIRQRMRSGEYRTVELTQIGEDAEAPRLLLEQHRLMDLDDDGIDEPYLIVVDKESQQVLKVEANFGPDDIEVGDPLPGRNTPNITIKPNVFYVKFDFFPHPQGKFYGIGFGHLLKPLTAIVNSCINQMRDYATAVIAGGGFIASGLRFQGRGQSSSLTFEPGEYKTVSSSGAALREGIVERTFPSQSPITFQLLELMLGAAKDIAALKDVTSGDASNNGQVGTTLALIEQGLKVYTAVYKRVFRSEREEFGLLYQNLARYGGDAVAQDYAEVLDDDEANFATDFNAADMDVRPVSDPESATRMQKMARAQFLLQTGKGDPNVDQHELLTRVYQAGDIEDIDKLVPAKPAPSGPPPDVVAELEKTVSEKNLNDARTEYTKAQTAQIGVEVGSKLGEADAHAEGQAQSNAGGLPGVAGSPGNGMGDEGAQPLQQQSPGGMDASLMGGGGQQPGVAG